MVGAAATTRVVGSSSLVGLGGSIVAGGGGNNHDGRTLSILLTSASPVIAKSFGGIGVCCLCSRHVGATHTSRSIGIGCSSLAVTSLGNTVGRNTSSEVFGHLVAYWGRSALGATAGAGGPHGCGVREAGVQACLDLCKVFHV